MFYSVKTEQIAMERQVNAICVLCGKADVKRVTIFI
jgi:hypothetical protein